MVHCNLYQLMMMVHCNLYQRKMMVHYNLFQLMMMVHCSLYQLKMMVHYNLYQLMMEHHMNLMVNCNLLQVVKVGELHRTEELIQILAQEHMHCPLHRSLLIKVQKDPDTTWLQWVS